MGLPRKTVVIILHQNNKILMQLRDDNPMISYPGNWGFFGGNVEPGEEPMRCAKRELNEEIKYETKEVIALSINRIFVPDEILIHSFYCLLRIKVEEINLYEGFDFGLFTFEQILSKQLFSTKAKRYFPVVNHPYMEYIVSKFKEKISFNIFRGN